VTPRDKRRARALQRATHWTLRRCTDIVTKHTDGEVERMLAEQKKHAPLTATMQQLGGIDVRQPEAEDAASRQGDIGTEGGETPDAGQDGESQERDRSPD